MNSLQETCLTAFASTFSFYLKAHGFHWNVVGRDFQEYHDLFGDVYSEVYGSIDDFAEKIRAIEQTIPASLSGIVQYSKIADCTDIPPPIKDAMVRELLADNAQLMQLLKLGYEACDAAGEYGFANFFADRMDAHRKHGWKLSSSNQL